MVKQIPSTAILVFSRSPLEEATYKSYVRQQQKNLKIATSIVAHTLKVASQTGLPVIRKFSNRQRGFNFGERLANAIEEVFAAGFSRVIVLGADTPDISAGIIRRIQSQINDRVLVTGPSADGGVYAIGISRSSWDRAAFTSIAWQTNEVQQDLALYAALVNAEHNTVAPLQDIDDRLSFYTWLGSKGTHIGVAGFMRRLLDRSVTFAHQQIIPSNYQEICRTHRGPPVIG